MKESILICERKVDDLILRGYRVREHYLVVVWGLGASPKRLVWDNFEEMNLTWLALPRQDAGALRTDLDRRPEGAQPRSPRIIRNPNRSRPGTERGGGPDRPYRTAAERSERPYRTGSSFERGSESPERPRFERPRRPFRPES